jgi:restriction system protein
MALEPDEFEVWSGMLLTMLGYRVLDTPQSGDHGVDLILSGNGILLGLVQCKRYRGTVSEATVRDLYGAMAHAGADHGYVITTGGFSRPARDWAQGKPIELWDGPKLLELARRFR